MSRELLQQALPLLEKSYPTLARKLCDEIHKFLAAQPAPVPLSDERLLELLQEVDSLAVRVPPALGEWARKIEAAAQPAPVPADLTMTRDELVAAAESIGMQWPAPVPVPLTADDIWLLWTRACEKPQLTRDLVCDFARAIIEAAHGIAASPEKP
jgi:hypothetical protein